MKYILKESHRRDYMSDRNRLEEERGMMNKIMTDVYGKCHNDIYYFLC